MSRTRSNTSRKVQAAKVAARSAQASGVIKCYVESYDRPDGLRDLRLREKVSRRIVRVLTRQTIMQHVAPLSNLLQDCYAHGGELVVPRGRKEYVAVSGSIVSQSDHEIAVSFDGRFAVEVIIQMASMASPPVSVWCYIEKYAGEGSDLGLRLRQKATGRKVEMYGRDKEHLTQFLASPQITGSEELLPNLYERHGYADYVLVSGGTAVDSFDVIRFEDGAELTYLLGPTPDTAYRDAFRPLNDVAAAMAHSRTAVGHLTDGRYREAVLSARLAVEVASGGGGSDVRDRLTGAPPDVEASSKLLRDKRNLAVHEGNTRIEQNDAEEAVEAMGHVLDFIGRTVAHP